MAFDEYYGDRKGTIHLDWYAVDAAGNRIDYGHMTDQGAHDHWALPRRVREILACRAWQEAPGLASAMPRPEKNLLSYLALAATPEAKSVAELGSSLYELYDGLRAARAMLCDVPQLPLEQMTYYGIEISELLRDTASALHPGIDLIQYPSATQLDHGVDFLYDRMVTSFAFETASECARFINQSRTGLLNLFLSLGDTFRSSWGGKALTYFSLAELIEELEQPLFYLFGDRAPGNDHSRGNACVEAFFLSGTAETAARFGEIASEDAGAQEYFAAKKIQLTPAAALLVSA
ncbi:MAG: hypothetical protein AAF581_06895 [Planctomycetota bacterium]